MITNIVKIDKENIDDSAIKEAAKIIREGGLVAFPTETVYGLGADALNAEASSKIYGAKGRPSDNPLIIHIAELEALYKIVKEVPVEAILLAKKFWPGPLTMIFTKSNAVPLETTGGLNTVAVRIPNHPIALELIKQSTGYVAAPSANVSGRPSPTLASHVAEDMDGKIPMIIDGGEVGIGLESTIIDLTEEKPVILRPGYITPQMLEETLKGPVRLDPAIEGLERKERPKAPGMRYRHYAPKASMTIIIGEQEAVTAYINEQTEKNREQGLKTGILCADETKLQYQGELIKSIGSREDEDTIARNLFAALREFDEADTDVIYAESFESDGLGRAVMNRLVKAAGHQFLRVQSMNRYKKVLFVEEHGDSRAPMAQAIFNEASDTIKSESRGLTVLFPTPINQKVEAVLKRNGLMLDNFETKELVAEDFTEDTLVVVMEEKHRLEIEKRFGQEAHVLTELTGEELEIMNPYGAPLSSYGLCFETLNITVRKLVTLLS